MARRAAVAFHRLPDQLPLPEFDAHYSELFLAVRAALVASTADATEFPSRRRRRWLDTAQPRGRTVVDEPPLPLREVQEAEALEAAKVSRTR